MKPSFVSLLIACCVTHLYCINAMAQNCPQYIHGSKDSAIALIKKADEYFQFNLLGNIDTTTKAHYIFSNDFCTFKIDLNEKKMLAGASVVTTFTDVKHIYISAPAERIEMFYNEYLLPLIQNCISKKNGYWVYYNKTIVLFSDAGFHQGIQLKSIDMEFREKM